MLQDLADNIVRFDVVGLGFVPRSYTVAKGIVGNSLDILRGYISPMLKKRMRLGRKKENY